MSSTPQRSFRSRRFSPMEKSKPLSSRHNRSLPSPSRARSLRVCELWGSPEEGLPPSARRSPHVRSTSPPSSRRRAPPRAHRPPPHAAPSSARTPRPFSPAARPGPCGSHAPNPRHGGLHGPSSRPHPPRRSPESPPPRGAPPDSPNSRSRVSARRPREPLPP